MRITISGFGLLWFLCLGVFQANCELAAPLSMQLKLSHSAGVGIIEVQIDAVNLGTGPADEIRAVVYAFGQTRTSGVLKRLDAKKTHRFRINIPVPSGKSGIYPLACELFFHDKKLYPFSTLSISRIDLGGGNLSGLWGSTRELTVRDRENLQVHIINASGYPRKVRATLYLPRSLYTAEKYREVTVDRGDRSSAVFTLVNRDAVHEASYPVYCVMEFDEGDSHQTAVVQTRVHLVQGRNWFLRYRWYWLGGAVLVIAGWTVIGVTGRKESVKS